MLVCRSRNQLSPQVQKRANSVHLGQINQHRNHAIGSPRPIRGWSPYPRGRGGGRGRGSAPVHRHRTLILNGAGGADAAAKSAGGDTVGGGGDGSDGDAGGNGGTNNGGANPSGGHGAGGNSSTSTSNSSGGSFVTKRDRHMQLINAAIYDRAAAARTAAIAESARVQAARKAEREQARVLRVAGRPVVVGGGSSSSSAAAGGDGGAGTRELRISVDGVPFRVVRGGSRLERVDGGQAGGNGNGGSVPKRVSIGGVRFVRSKGGNLIRQGAVVRHAPAGVAAATVQAQQRPRKKDELCRRFTATGRCYKGPACRYTHDPHRVALCKRFQATGECAGGDCDLSHTPTAARAPVCVHLLRGHCANGERCRFAHVDADGSALLPAGTGGEPGYRAPPPDAPVCAAYALLGYCGAGARCRQRHVHECPAYAARGECRRRRCGLPHVDRAGRMRGGGGEEGSGWARGSGGDGRGGGGGGDETDESASSESAADSSDSGSDVDSDAEVEFVSGVDTGELERQDDFIGL